jgi:hypothetical protein
LDAVALHTIARGAEYPWLSKLGLSAALALVQGIFLFAGAVDALNLPSWKKMRRRWVS